jgi:hypothetical protein
LSFNPDAIMVSVTQNREGAVLCARVVTSAWFVPVAQLAEKAIQEKEMADQMKVMKKRSDELVEVGENLPEQVHVPVSCADTIRNCLLFEFESHSFLSSTFEVHWSLHCSLGIHNCSTIAT